MQRRLGTGEEAIFRFGIRDEAEMETWGDGLELLGDWSYLDEPDKKIGALRWFRRFEMFRKALWVVHYRLC